MRTELVGREAELATLADGLEAALAGQPRLVLCRGEPGIGKTRLAEDLVGLARTRGVPGVWGAAVDSAGAPPYWPWRQVLRAIGIRTHLRAFAQEHRLRIDLARLAPEVFADADRPADCGGSVEDRFRQFDATARLLRQLTLQEPLVIVIDDAHWADRPSLLLLQHVARTLRDGKPLMIVNYRDTEQAHGGLFTDLLRKPVTRHRVARSRRFRSRQSIGLCGRP